MSDCAFEITEKMFQMKPIDKGGRMHGAACLVNSKGDIRASEVKVLKSTDNPPIKVRIVGKGGTGRGACRRTRYAKWFKMFHFQHFENR